MIETLKKELLPGMATFDLRNTLEEVSNHSKTEVSMKMTSIATKGETRLHRWRARLRGLEQGAYT